MKKLFTLICLFAFVPNIQAQDAPPPKTNLFENDDIELDSAYMTIPGLHYNNSQKKGYTSQNNEWMKEYLRDPLGDIKSATPNLNLSDGSNMPIYNPQSLAEMPISKPDSSNKYHILIIDLSGRNSENSLIE